MFKTRVFNLLRGLMILALFATSAGWADNLKQITSLSGQASNDFLAWEQFGGDGTLLAASFPAQTATGHSATVTLAGPYSIVSYVCGSQPCSWTQGTGFLTNDRLLWASDLGNGGNGPITLNFAQKIAGGGAIIQADAPGQFTAQIQAFNGSTSLGVFTVTSNPNGDAAYIGVLDQTGANITSLVFSVINCAGPVCSDFAMDAVRLNESGGQGNFTLTLAVNPGGAGSITANPLPQNGVYASGTKVCLTASANHGWAFSSWSGDPLDLNGCLIMDSNKSETANFMAAPSALQFIAAVPCRLVDTRNPNGEFGGPPLQGGTKRDFVIPDNTTCKIPSTAAAYSLNVTVVPHAHRVGYLTVWPAGQNQPLVSTLNSDGRTKANAAIVPAGNNGAVSVYVSDTTDLVLDIDGYFVPANGSTLEFYPLRPCRVADTRKAPGDLGGPYLQAKVQRDFPILTENTCQIPGTAQALSLNFTAVPHGYLEYVTVWPTGSNRPTASTLNAPTGKATANAAIVPTGTGGKISTYAFNDTDLIIDVNGYFAAPGTGGLSLYPVVPCRVLDTRPPTGTGAFKGQLSSAVDPVHSACSTPSQAMAYVFNATVVPQGPLDYLALWPDGLSQPVVSTLNAYDGVISSNMAIVPAGTTNGKVDAYANPKNPSDPSDLTNLILDISSYFAP